MSAGEPVEPVAAPLRGRPNVAVHMAGLTLLALAPGLAVSAAVEVGAGGDQAPALLLPAALAAAVGWFLRRQTRVPERVAIRMAFASVAWTWVAAAVVGALPFVLAGTLGRFDDALVESVSGFSGTGSTVLVPIEGHSRGVLFWRQLTQWYGGMGMVVLAVAILPFLGVGGLELLRSESPGPSPDRLAPRVRQTAYRLWQIYLILTLVVVVTLLVLGLSPYDAVTHAFTTVSTGGFSPYDASIGAFDSLAVEVALSVLMIAGAVNFTLHWRAAHGDVGAYWRRAELRTLLALVGAAFAAVVVANTLGGADLADAARSALFMVPSLATSTGFGTDDIAQWAPLAQIVALFLMMAGGMAGSTAGGMKLLRVRVMVEYAWREVRRANRPRLVTPIRLGRESVEEATIARISSFVLTFIAIGVASVVVVTALGSDPLTAIGAVASSMGNTGPGLGEAGSDLLSFSRPARLYLATLMLVGRLEIYAFVIGMAAVVNLAPRRRVRRARRVVRARLSDR